MQWVRKKKKQQQTLRYRKQKGNPGHLPSYHSCVWGLYLVCLPLSTLQSCLTCFIYNDKPFYLYLPRGILKRMSFWKWKSLVGIWYQGYVSLTMICLFFLWHLSDDIIIFFKKNIGWALAGVAQWIECGLQVDSQSGHMPGLRARSSVEATWEATTHWCFLSLSFSIPSPLSKYK